MWEAYPVWGFIHLIQFSIQLYKLCDMYQFRSEGHNKAEGKAVWLPVGIRHKYTAWSRCMAKPLQLTMVPPKTLPIVQRRKLRLTKKLACPDNSGAEPGRKQRLWVHAWVIPTLGYPWLEHQNQDKNGRLEGNNHRKKGRKWRPHHMMRPGHQRSVIIYKSSIK